MSFDTVMLSVIMLNVVMLSATAPKIYLLAYTLAYFVVAPMTLKKEFYSNDTNGLNNNRFTNVIYNRNDSGQYYKTMILANLALARSINYDHKVCCRLKRKLRS